MSSETSRKSKKYQIILADPPWSYYNDSDSFVGITTVVGMRNVPYRTLASKKIMALPVSKIADDNCILFIWTTDYHLEKCLQVIKCWGFKYVTVGFVWAKKNKQGKPICFMGAYTLKSGSELCLLATKGQEIHKLVKNHKVRALVESERETHSKKPEEVRKRIVELMGNLPRIELFARQKVEGWDCWGNEVESDIEL